MTIVPRVLVLVTSFVVLAAGAGLLLPAGWHVERSVVIQASPASVFLHLNSLKRWPEWTSWSARDPDARLEYSGPEAGVGATSRWSGKEGRGAIKIMESDNDRKLEYQLLFDGGEWAMRGVLRLSAEGTGTRVVWQVSGAVGRNPLERYAALLMPRWIGRDLEESLQRLRGKLETAR